VQEFLLRSFELKKKAAELQVWSVDIGEYEICADAFFSGHNL